MANTPEGRVKDKVKKYLKAHGIWYYMPVQTGWGVAGIPDFVCCWGGVFVGIETKAPGKANNLSAHQKRVKKEIANAGGLYAVVTSEDEVANQFRLWRHEGYGNDEEKKD